MKKLLLLCGIVLFSSCASMKTAGYFVTESNVTVTGTPDMSKEIKRFESGSTVPDGYELVTIADFKTGVITVKCGEMYMVDEAKKLCRKLNGDAIRFFEVKEPDLIDTCYRGKVMILRRKGGKLRVN